VFKTGTLTPQFLGALRIVPDSGVFQFAAYFVEAFELAVIVKDTPSGQRYALACL
jgi:hypothetical protein